jgi:hypothetical protein
MCPRRRASQSCATCRATSAPSRTSSRARPRSGVRRPPPAARRPLLGPWAPTARVGASRRRRPLLPAPGRAGRRSPPAPAPCRAGAAAIRARLQELNHAVRSRERQLADEQLLQIYCPFAALVGGQGGQGQEGQEGGAGAPRVFFLDTPGPNEAGEEGLRHQVRAPAPGWQCGSGGLRPPRPPAPAPAPCPLPPGALSACPRCPPWHTTHHTHHTHTHHPARHSLHRWSGCWTLSTPWSTCWTTPSSRPRTRRPSLRGCAPSTPSWWRACASASSTWSTRRTRWAAARCAGCRLPAAGCPGAHCAALRPARARCRLLPLLRVARPPRQTLPAGSNHRTSRRARCGPQPAPHCADPGPARLPPRPAPMPSAGPGCRGYPRVCGRARHAADGLRGLCAAAGPGARPARCRGLPAVWAAAEAAGAAAGRWALEFGLGQGYGRRCCCTQGGGTAQGPPLGLGSS